MLVTDLEKLFMIICYHCTDTGDHKKPIPEWRADEFQGKLNWLNNLVNAYE